VIPPWRAYPIFDDWAYAQSVERLLALDYRPHDFTQPSSLGHLVWGVVSVGLFGFSFNVLTATNLLISAACLVLFYVLLRQVGIVPAYALFGTALIGCNPIYLYLSYSFMTDITFMAYVLGACICYIAGVRSGNNGWLWAGGVLVALAYLTRQTGVMVAVGALLYLWWVRRLSLRTTAAAALVPVLAVVAFMVWERSQPEQMVRYLFEDEVRKVLANPWHAVVEQTQRVVWVVGTVGWALLPLLLLPIRPLVGLALYAGFVLFQIRGFLSSGMFFPGIGSIVGQSGFMMYGFDMMPVWDRQVWSAIALAGTFFLAQFLVSYGERLVAWARSRPRSVDRDGEPAFMLYTSAALLGTLTLASTFLFDRYLLPLIPFLMIPALYRLQGSTGRPAPGWRWALILPLLVFGLFAQLDFKSKATARWEAAESVVAQGVLPEHVRVGIEWTGWKYYDKAIAYVRSERMEDNEALLAPERAIDDPQYVVGELPLEGYDVVRRIPYSAWLEGGEERAVLVQKRK
jgi:4-amino-4-deoxy-L-arabinose transferase-like glycosyltransferase